MYPSIYFLGVMAFLPMASHAQSPADPSQPTSAVAYRSVFVDTPQGAETDSLDWKTANRQVGQFPRGHIDILKWEAAQAKAKAETPAEPPLPSPEHRKP